jgi:hypothetical protein
MLELNCASDEKGQGPFQLSVRFGDGFLIALTEPQTGKVDRLVYDAEVLTGTLHRPGSPAQTIVFTRATSLRASLVGTGITSNGDLVSLVIRSAATGQSDRAFTLFETAGATLLHGSCRG